MTQVFRSCSTGTGDVINFLVGRSPLLPSLEQVRAVMAELEREQLARPLVATSSVPKFAHRIMAHKDLRQYDEDWQKPTSTTQKRLQKRIVQSRAVKWPFFNGKECSARHCREQLSRLPVEHGWSLDFTPSFVAELLYEGITPQGAEVPLHGHSDPVQVLV